MSKADWQRNVWTGTDSLDVAPNARIIRQPFANAAPLYRAEFWGDYSLNYPVKAGWRKSLAHAKADAARLARASR